MTKIKLLQPPQMTMCSPFGNFLMMGKNKYKIPGVITANIGGISVQPHNNKSSQNIICPFFDMLY